MTPNGCVPLVIAARQLRRSYHATLNAVLRGDLHGWKDDRGRWLVSASSVSGLVAAIEAAGREPEVVQASVLPRLGPEGAGQ